MANYKVVNADQLDADLTSVADAIREKTGGSEALSFPDGMVAQLKMIPDLIVNSASGNPITLSDSSNMRLLGLNLYGKTTQDGTPTPEAPVELVSAGDGGSIGITVAGKNLLIYDEWKKAVNNNNCTVVWENNGVTITATKNDAFTSYSIPNFPESAKVPVMEGDTITLSWEESTNAVGGVYIFPNGKTSGLVSANNRDVKKLSYTVAPGVTFVTFRFGVTTSGTIISYKNIQIELGVTATAYEPYKPVQTLTASTPNGLPGIPVTSGGNYTDETGQQWVCDEVDFGRGVYVQRVHRQVFNGSESWENGFVSTGDAVRPFTALSVNIVMPPDAFSKAPAMCDSYNQKTPDETWYKAEGFAVNATYNRVIFYDSAITSISAWKTRLTATPINCLFQLATPVETALSAEELAAYAVLHTNYPSTTILNDGGAGMSVSYVADTKNYIDNKISAMAAAIVNA